ncbi:MAG: phosphatase PAP2 family protein [Anaerolineae bacterium]|jgi:membrane-associated phospholipid phosphatase
MGEWLEGLVPWGTEVLAGVQTINSDWVVALFAIFSFFGSEQFYLILLPLVYWCIDRDLGARLAYLSMLSAWLNSVVKHLFGIPRPADARLETPYPETSPSFPSGHAQGAIVNWGYLALALRRRAFTILALLMILGISFSRMVLAVHFPQDILGGWAIGLVLMILFIWAEPRAGRWFGGLSPAAQAGLAFAGPTILIFIHPADWLGPYPAEGAITPMAALAGLGLGMVMERAWLRFRADGPLGRRALRFLVGLVLVGIFYAGPSQLLPEEMPYALEASLRFVRYLLVGWVAGFGCPWLFVRLGLAEREEGP